MKRLLLIISTALFIAPLCAQPIVYDWAKSLGGKSTYDGSIGMAKDASGNIYITGEFAGNRTFGSFSLNGTSFSQVYVAKYDPSGTCLWAVKGGASFSTAYAGKVVVFGNSVYVTGNFSNVIDFGGTAVLSAGNKDVFIASLDISNGAPNWVQAAGGTYEDNGVNITTNSGGGVYVCGTFNGSATFGSFTLNNSSFSNSDIFVAKYASNGLCIWAKSFGGTGLDIAQGIKEIPIGGEILLTGSFENTITFGTTILTSVGYSDFYLARLDNLGNVISAVSGGSENTDVGNSVTFDAAGYVYVTGFIADTATFGTITVNNSQVINVFVAKFNAASLCLWVRHGGNALDDIGNDIVADLSGSTYFTGYLSGNSTFGSTTVTGVQALDGVVGKYDTNGTLKWITRVGSTGNDKGKAILLDVAGYCIVAGDYTNTANFGSTALTSPSGTYQTYLARMGGGTLGINNQIETPFSFYPNPANDNLHIDLHKINDLTFTVELISMTGAVIIQQQPTLKDATSDYQMNLSTVPAGNYILRISTSKGDFEKSLVVLKK